MQFVTVEDAIKILEELKQYDLTVLQKSWCQRLSNTYQRYENLTEKQINVICDIYCSVRSNECQE